MIILLLSRVLILNINTFNLQIITVFIIDQFLFTKLDFRYRITM